MAVNYTSARFSAEDDNGRPLSGGRLFTYQNGTTTPAVTYKDAAGTTPNTNPIILDARGEAVVYLQAGQVYTFVLQNRFGSLIWSQNGVMGSASTLDLAQFQAQFNQYKADLAGNNGSTLLGFKLPTMKSVLRLLSDWLSERPVSVRDFGAKGDDATDDSTAFQDWMNYIHDNQRDGYVPPGTYRINTQTVKPASFYCPVIRGAGRKATILKGPGNTAVWSIQGGSGGPSGGMISDITFNGMNSATGFGIEVADQCELPIRNCGFTTARYGVLLHNLGGFTEYVTVENCEFSESVSTDIGYKRTAGTDSFHGSGIRACTSNEAVGSTTAKIEIGGTLIDKGITLTTSNNIIVYNAILECQVWKQTGIPYIANFSTRPSVNFHGDVTFEVFGTNEFDFASAASNSIVFHNGDITELNNYVRRGAMYPYFHLSGYPDGSSRPLLKPYPERLKSIGGGVSLVAQLYSTGGESYEVEVVIKGAAGGVAPNYKQVWNLRCHIEPGLPGQILANRTFVYFGGDFGADPVFALTATGQLIVTLDNAVPAGAATLRSTITQTGYPNGSAF